MCYNIILRDDLFPCTAGGDLFPCTADIQAIVSTHVETVVQLVRKTSDTYPLEI